MGLFDVRQHAIPLETVITRVGAHPGAGGPAPRALRRAARQRRPRGRAERGHRPLLGRQLPRSYRRPEAVAPELRADAGGRTDPVRRAKRANFAARARGGACATRRSCATTRRARPAQRRRARQADRRAPSSPRSPPAPPDAASCARARATRPSPIRSCSAHPGEVRVRLEGDASPPPRARVATYTHAAERRAGRRHPARAAREWRDGRHAAIAGRRQVSRLRRHLGAARAAHSPRSSSSIATSSCRTRAPASPPRSTTPFDWTLPAARER